MRLADSLYVVDKVPSLSLHNDHQCITAVCSATEQQQKRRTASRACGAVHVKRALEMSDFAQGQCKLITYNSDNRNKTQQEGFGWDDSSIPSIYPQGAGVLVFI